MLDAKQIEQLRSIAAKIRTAADAAVAYRDELGHFIDSASEFMHQWADNIEAEAVKRAGSGDAPLTRAEKIESIRTYMRNAGVPLGEWLNDDVVANLPDYLVDAAYNIANRQGGPNDDWLKDTFDQP